MLHVHRKIQAVIVVLLLPFVFFSMACAKKDEKEGRMRTPSSGFVETREKVQNPLTGMEMPEGSNEKSRPVAIMINNIRSAQPLLGVKDSDIMFECLVEGGITRILAVFKDPSTVKTIGSIRSARPDFIHLTAGLDAYYVHIGGSVQADQMLQAGVVEDVNLGVHSAMMWRDEKRRRSLGYEHSAVTSGEKLMKGLQNIGSRKEVREENKKMAVFSEKSSVLQGRDARKVSAKFSNYKSTNFSYDEGSKCYLVSQFNTAQMDGNSNEQNTRKNVFIIKAKSYAIDKEGHMIMDLVGGSGSGIYCSHGKCEDIRWSKKSVHEPLRFYENEGKELTMIPGNSYVCLIPLEQSVSIE